MKLDLTAPLAAGALLFSTAAHAKDVVVKRTFDVQRPMAELVRQITAYDQYCARGCRYRVPSVVVTRILSYARRPDDFYTWTAVKDIKDSSWFSHCVITRRSHGARIEQRMVGTAMGATLQRATRHEHTPSVDASVNTYEIEEIPAGDKPARTRITLTETVSISGVSAFFGSGIVRDRLEEAARAMRRNLTRAATAGQ